jgi:hypothetical protein
VVDKATGEKTPEFFKAAFGPYLYYRWKEGGRTRTAYLGKPEEALERLWKLGGPIRRSQPNEGRRADS